MAHQLKRENDKRGFSSKYKKKNGHTNSIAVCGWVSVRLANRDRMRWHIEVFKYVAFDVINNTVFMRSNVQQY